MIIVHEDSAKEASWISERFRQLYNLESKIEGKNLDSVFAPIPHFKGYGPSEINLSELLEKNYGEKNILVITPRDIYVGKSQEDDWIFGYCWANINLASHARMKRQDNKPSDILEVDENLYRKRLEILAVHEVGHSVVKAPHYQNAVWVNEKIGHELSLGPHCTNNDCVMYEVVDIKTPPKEEGHMRLGIEKKFDAGLDEVISRLNPNWFCDKCLPNIKISNNFM